MTDLEWARFRDFNTVLGCATDEQWALCLNVNRSEIRVGGFVPGTQGYQVFELCRHGGRRPFGFFGGLW